MQHLHLGIDQSYTSTGIVVLDNNKQLVHSEIITSSKNDDIFARAYYTANEISSIVERFKPQYVGLEGLAFSKIGNATRDLAGLQFTIVQRLRYTHKYNDNMIIVAPNELKKYATTKGNADKVAMFNSLPIDISDIFKTHYKKTKGLYDITDAYWITRYTIEVADKKQSILSREQNQTN